MALETELKLSLPPRTASRFAAHPLLAGLASQRQKLLNTYYDTPELTLQHERIGVRYRRKGRQWLLTVKCAAPSAGGLARRLEWENPGRPGEFDFSHVDHDHLRQRLETLRPGLQAAFTTDFVRTAWLIDTGKARIELALDRGHIIAGGQRETICEVELELLDGDPAELFRLALELQADLPLHPEVASKAERAYRLFTGAPLKPARAGPSPITEAMDTTAAFQAIALDCLAQLQGNECGLHETEAPEFAHQARVAIRRLRSALRLWQKELPEGFVGHFDARWKALAGELAEVRNDDVFFNETLPLLEGKFPAHPELTAFAEELRERQTAAREKARRAVSTRDYGRLLLEFAANTHALPATENDGLPHFSQKRLTALGRRLKDRARLARRSGRRKADALHRLRLALKHLRYALEFFAPLLPRKAGRRHHRAASHLLSQLGHSNDLTIAADLMRQADAPLALEPMRRYLVKQNRSLRPSLRTPLRRLLRRKMPWKKQG